MQFIEMNSSAFVLDVRDSFAKAGLILLACLAVKIKRRKQKSKRIEVQ
jgi:hypothetical protein